MHTEAEREENNAESVAVGGRRAAAEALRKNKSQDPTSGNQAPCDHQVVTNRHGAEAGFGFVFMKPWFVGHGFGFITFLKHWLRLQLHNFPRALALALASASYLSQGFGFGFGFETNGVASDLTTG